MAVHAAAEYTTFWGLGGQNTSNIDKTVTWPWKQSIHGEFDDIAKKNLQKITEE